MSLKQKVERLAHQNQSLVQTLAKMGGRLHASVQLLSAIASLTDIPLRFNQMIPAAREGLRVLVREVQGVEACSLLLYQPERDRLELLAAHGRDDLLGLPSGPYNQALFFRPGEGLAGRVFAEGKPRFWNPGQGSGVLLEPGGPRRTAPRSLASLPLLAPGRRLGVLNLSFGEAQPFDYPRQRDLILTAGVVSNMLLTFLLSPERRLELYWPEARTDQTPERTPGGNEALAEVETKGAFWDLLSREFRLPAKDIAEVAGRVSEVCVCEGRRGGLERVCDSAGRILNLAEDLAFWGRLESGIFRTRDEPFDLTVLLDTLVESLSEAYGPGCGRLTLCLAPSTPTRLVGHGQGVAEVLKRVLMLSLSPEGAGALELEVGRSSGDASSLTLCFGITNICNEHVLDRLKGFSPSGPFMAESGAEPLRGLGLSLRIVLKLVTLMDGRIWIEGGPGPGGTVRMAFPFDAMD